MDEDRFQETFDKLKEARDELRVKLDLGEKEAKAAWEDLQEDWKRLEERAEKVRDDATDAGEALGQDARELIEDIGSSISKLRDRFS